MKTLVQVFTLSKLYISHMRRVVWTHSQDLIIGPIIGPIENVKATVSDNSSNTQYGCRLQTLDTLEIKTFLRIENDKKRAIK